MTEQTSKPQQSKRLESMGARLAEVVHDLRNPLGSIMALAEILERNAKAGDQRLIANLKENATQCRAIVDDLLFFSSDRHAPVEEFQPVKMLSSALEGRPARLSGIVVRAVATGPDFDFRGRPEDVKRLVMNLLRNAEDAMAKNESEGRVTIRFGPSSKGFDLVIEVDDEGPGFPEHFDLDEPGLNAGLGLQICRRVVREHLGRWESSNRLEGGGRVRLTLSNIENSAATVPQPLTPTVAEGDQAVLPALKILVVDDDRNTAETYQRILSLEGHEIETCDRGRAGLSKLLNSEFDLALVDVKLPDLSGPSFFAELKQKDPAKAQRVLFATGDVSNEDTVRFLNKTGNPFLIKPFELAELRAAMLTLLQNCRDQTS
ncbi:MAG: response regulator [Planctomycetota bacterium]